MTVTEVATLQIYEEIINSDNFSVFTFWASWCGHCRMISPVFEKISDSDEYPNVKFCRVDIDAAPEVAEAAEIRVMPTFIVFKNGEREGGLTGANPVALHALLARVIPY
ncbi:hypothetical protein FRC03_001106 [Tulasnella sp. 419]|nr:hypothetical protein FRC03_001106 [Tulasnella sp. 419]